MFNIESFSNVYKKLVLEYSWPLLIFIICLSILALAYSLDFELDASADSLVLENDENLKYYRSIRDKYGTDEFIVITYKPYDDLLSKNSLDGIRILRDELLALDSIHSVTSILDVPIIYNSNEKLTDIQSNLKNIESEGIDLEIARKNLQPIHFIKNLLVSEMEIPTAIEVVFKQSPEYYNLVQQRSLLREKSLTSDLSLEESLELERIIQQIKKHNSDTLSAREKDIESIREIVNRQSHRAVLYIGGIPMITVDMINYIRHDLVIFGLECLYF